MIGPRFIKIRSDSMLLSSSTYSAADEGNTTNSSDPGLESASKLCISLLHACEKLNQMEIVDMCRVALIANHEIISSFSTAPSFSQRPLSTMLRPTTTKGLLEESSPLSPGRITPHIAVKMDSNSHAKNFAIRFDHEEKEIDITNRSKARWSVSRSRKAMGRALFGAKMPLSNCDYEEIIDESILQAAISDLIIIQSGEVVPDGFYRLSKNMRNKKGALNSGVPSSPSLYLCLKKVSDSSTELPITALLLVYPDRNQELIPPGYYAVRRNSVPCNLNANPSSSSSTERVFLCYRKDYYGNPIIDLQIVLKGDEIPNNFHRIDKSQSGTQAYLNIGTTTTKVFLAYRTYLERLECLWNEEIAFPLVSKVILKKFFFDVKDNTISETDATKEEIRKHSINPSNLSAIEEIRDSIISNLSENSVKSFAESSVSDSAISSVGRSNELPSRARPSPTRLSIYGEMRNDITVVSSAGTLVSFGIRRLLHPILASLSIRSTDSTVGDPSLMALQGV